MFEFTSTPRHLQSNVSILENAYRRFEALKQ